MKSDKPYTAYRRYIIIIADEPQGIIKYNALFVNFTYMLNFEADGFFVRFDRACVRRHRSSKFR